MKPSSSLPLCKLVTSHYGDIANVQFGPHAHLVLCPTYLPFPSILDDRLPQDLCCLFPR